MIIRDCCKKLRKLVTIKNLNFFQFLLCSFLIPWKAFEWIPWKPPLDTAVLQAAVQICVKLVFPIAGKSAEMFVFKDDSNVS